MEKKQKIGLIQAQSKQQPMVRRKWRGCCPIIIDGWEYRLSLQYVAEKAPPAGKEEVKENHS